MRTPILISLLGLSLLACRSDNNTTVDAPPGGNPDAPAGGTVTIQQIQDNAMAPGTAVSVKGVVVTAIDNFGTKVGDFWVEDPAGGAFSGVHIFGGPVATVATLAVGDIVSISGGVKDEFALASDTSGRTLTEIGAGPSGMMITKTGTGTVPAPMVVDALAIGQMAPAARDAEWEKWEGVLITVNHVSSFGKPKCVGSACSDPTLQNVKLTGQLVAESSLAAFPATGIDLNLCLGSVTGVEDYFFDYLLLPRMTSEVVTGGTGCPAPEQAAGLAIGTCGDGIDNDGNGFSDCMDLGCEVGANAWLGATCAATDVTCGCSTNFATNSATAVNTATTLPTGGTLMHNMFVLAVTAKGFYVADSLTAAANGGLFVFQGSAPTVTAGQKLATLQGNVKAFNPSKLTTGAQTLLELNNPTAGAATASGPGIPIALTATVAGDLVMGKPYAASLVQLSNVKVKSIGMFNQVTLVDNSNVTITLDDTVFAFYGGTSAAPTPPAVGTCFKTLAGLMDLTTTDTAGMMEVRTINPRSAADMMSTGGNCTGV